MPAGVRHVVPAATVVLLIALAAPAGAMAGGCKASACKVYHESGAPSAGGQQQPKQTQQQPQQQPTGSTSNGGKQKQAPTKLSRVLANAGADKAPLSRLLNDSGIGAVAAGPASAGSPSALGAVSDLGTGPMALLAILLATAVAFAVQGGVRGWLRRRAGA